MKIVIVGGTGLIGAKAGALLRKAGHEVVAASPSRGIDAVTGAGLAPAVAGAGLVIGVSSAPSFEPEAVLEFFATVTRNLLAAEAGAGVGHHVALSVVGVDRMPDHGYFRAKLAQERLIAAGGIPFTIVRATQFMEFIDAILAANADGDAVRLSPALFQPIAADDVAALLVELALAAPRNASIDIAGPERAPLTEIAARYLGALGDPRRVVADPRAGYFGGRLEERSLVPLGEGPLGGTTLDAWLRRAKPGASAGGRRGQGSEP